MVRGFGWYRMIFVVAGNQRLLARQSGSCPFAEDAAGDPGSHQRRRRLDQMDDGQEFPVRVEIVMHQLQHAVHVPGQHTEIERALLVDVLHPVEAQVLLADHEPGRVGHLGDRPVVPARQIPVTGAVFSQQRLHLPNFLERQAHTQTRHRVGAGVGIAHRQQSPRQVALLLVAQPQHVGIAEIVDGRCRLQPVDVLPDDRGRHQVGERAEFSGGTRRRIAVVGHQ